MKKFNYIKILIIIINLIVIIRLVDVSIVNRKTYISMRDEITNKYISTNYAPRGRILDTKGNILVDNKKENILVFRNYNFSNGELVNIIDSLADLIDLDVSVTDTMRREYYYFLNSDEIDKRVDEDIYKAYRLKNINSNTFYNHKLSKIKEEELQTLDAKKTRLYYLITNGYSFDDKIIKYSLSNEELTKINEAKIPGIRCEAYFKRVYNYDSSINQLFGTIGNITKELSEYYLDKGYKSDDIVGISFLEYVYDDYLKGKPRIYKVLDDNSIEVISDYEKGNDLVLSIDIEKQLEIEKILKTEMSNTKKYVSSKYYNGSYITVSDNYGRVIVMAGYKYDDGMFNYDALGNITNSYTVGSVVKGASQSVAFINDVIDENKYVTDGCVKLYLNPAKCSWKRLGRINDIDALTQSSNYYQFINAIKVTGNEYSYNMKLEVSEADFEKYRSVFRDYGLGSDNGFEISGYKGITGSKISGDLLLNLSIGQYDTYTPLMLNNYIGTIANDGTRYNMSIGSYFIDNEGKRVDIEKKVLSKVNIDIEDIKRVQLGLNGVVTKGTGASYIDKVTGAGKTGTSETYVNGHKTNTRSFILYFPFEDPKYNLTIVSPNLVDSNSQNSYNYPLNSKLSRQITNILFEN